MMFSVWGDVWYVTYLKTLGLAIGGFAVAIILSYVWDKRKEVKKDV